MYSCILLPACVLLGPGPVSSSEHVEWQALSRSDMWRGCENEGWVNMLEKEGFWAPGRLGQVTAVPELFLSFVLKWDSWV